MRQGKFNCRLKMVVFFLLLLSTVNTIADNEYSVLRLAQTRHVNRYFNEQLSNPQKKNRKSLSQFGYNLSTIPFPIFPITQFINPSRFGLHCYGQPHRKEKNGALYTCRGGFIDFSHLRCAADWTVYLTFKLVTEQNDLELEPEGGSLKLCFQKLNELTLEDKVSLAQKITFERLVWHEITSWHYHLPNYIGSEQQSTFTPEDVYSDFLGTEIGRKIALRILKNFDTLSYSQIATEEIAKTIAFLQPMKTKNETAQAYDIVDRSEQSNLPEDEQNKDVWWDSHIVFTDVRYCFKRSMEIGPTIEPWLVPQAARLGCKVDTKAQILPVPQQTVAGESFYNYYEFTISPDSLLFFAKKSRKQIHTPLTFFTTKDLDGVMAVVHRQMEEKLLSGFDKRDNFDPVPQYKRVTKVWFKW